MSESTALNTGRCWGRIGFAQATLRWFAENRSGTTPEFEQVQAGEAYKELQWLFEELREHFAR